MTDNEIIKALECCNMRSYPACCECPYHEQYSNNDCINKRNTDIADLINRLTDKLNSAINGQETLQEYIAKQEKEIERLKELLEEWKTQAYKIADDKDELTRENSKLKLTLFTAKYERYKGEFENFRAEIKAEAYKEFAERLKNEIIGDTAYVCDTNQHSGYYDYQIKIGDIPEYIDNLLKEMKGK